MKTDDPARTAQWLAAYTMQGATVAVTCAKRGIRDYGQKSSVVFREFLMRIAQRGAAKDLKLCPHLDYASPAPSYWMAWHPEMLRCAACVRKVVEPEVEGVDNQDLTCDRCGFVSARLADVWSGYGQIAAMTPLPIVVICGLCETCAKGDGL